MASSADVREIMGLAGPTGSELITRETIFGSEKPKKNYNKKNEALKRPEGMARELYNLLYNDSKDAPPIIPTDSSIGKDKGYKQLKAKLGMRKVRPWKWMPFTNPARKDGLVLSHWRRAADEGKEYAFARFNKQLEMPTFSDAEYHNHLMVEGWTRAETDHLLDLCGRFDLRFIVVHDRWNRELFKKERTVEELKERYYGIVEKLELLHPDPSKAGSKPFHYDADHERRRKEQLQRLYDRSPEEVEEENMLRAELKKIEARKREREKKTQDLQKLIAQADSTTSASKMSAGSLGTPTDKKSFKKKFSTGGVISSKSPSKDASLLDSSSGIKFPDIKSSGPSLRSMRMKLPTSLGQKKTKAVEQMLQEVGVDAMPVPTEEICAQFNDLRSDMVLLYELKNGLNTCEHELHSLKAQYEALCPGKSLEIPEKLKLSVATPGARGKSISDVIDVVSNGANQPVRKRKAALEQGNVLLKIKNKQF